MRSTRSTKHARKTGSTWRVRAVQLALALTATGLMTAIAAAAIGAKQGPSNDGAMAAAILAQQIAEGVPTTAPVSAPVSPPAGDAMADAVARQSILAEAAHLEHEMQVTLEHTDKLKTAAYKAKDIIRLNTITGKLEDMKAIMIIANQAFAAIRIPGQDLFVMRAKLSTIQQGWDRMREALAVAESAEGDSVDWVSSGLGPENAEATPNDGTTDPGTPASPQVDVARPGYASPFQ